MPAATCHARGAVPAAGTPRPAPGTSDAARRGRPRGHSTGSKLSWGFSQLVPVPPAGWSQFNRQPWERWRQTKPQPEKDMGLLEWVQSRPRG